VLSNKEIQHRQLTPHLIKGTWSQTHLLLLAINTLTTIKEILNKCLN